MKYYILSISIISLCFISLFMYDIFQNMYLFKWRDIIKYDFQSEMSLLHSVILQRNEPDYSIFFKNLKEKWEDKLSISNVLYSLTWKDMSNGIKDNFKLEFVWKKCFYFKLSTSLFRDKEKYFTGYMKDNHFNKCNLGMDCNIYFTELWLLKATDLYNCK